MQKHKHGNVTVCTKLTCFTLEQMRRKLNTENKILLVIRFKFRNFILIFISRKLLKHLSAALFPDMKCSPQHDSNFHFSWTITKHNVFHIRFQFFGEKSLVSVLKVPAVVLTKAYTKTSQLLL